jgi:hypothetical protein
VALVIEPTFAKYLLAGVMSENHMCPDVDYINPIKTLSLSPLHVYPTQMKLTPWYGLRSIKESSDVNKDGT